MIKLTTTPANDNIFARARLDADGTARPLTRLLGHVRAGDCVGSVRADTIEVVATGNRVAL